MDGSGRLAPTGRLLAGSSNSSQGQQQQQQQQGTGEPPRTLLRGILSQQPAPGTTTAGSGSSSGATTAAAAAGTLGLVNLHSILQPGHPALRPNGEQLLLHPLVKPGNYNHSFVSFDNLLQCRCLSV